MGKNKPRGYPSAIASCCSLSFLHKRSPSRKRPAVVALLLVDGVWQSTFAGAGGGEECSVGTGPEMGTWGDGQVKGSMVRESRKWDRKLEGLLNLRGNMELTEKAVELQMRREETAFQLESTAQAKAGRCQKKV